MGITLDNTGDSGSVDITLNYVIGYDQGNTNKYAVKNVPGKVTPTVDTATFIKSPRIYNIRVKITDAQKVTLETLNDEEDKQIKLTDNELSNKNVRPISVRFVAVPGNTEMPWIANITLQAEDH